MVFETVPGREGGAGREQDATQEEKRVLSLVDGKRSVEEVVRLSGQGEFEAYSTLYEALRIGEVRERSS